MLYDFIIVGQGLAGSLLAWHLLQHRCRILIVDNGVENASQIAAGLINPVTGLRLVKTSGVDQFLPLAQHCYAELGRYFKCNFYIEQPMLRLLRKPEEKLAYTKRQQDNAYQSYLGGLRCSQEFSELISTDPWLEQTQTGYLLTRPLLQHLKTFFSANACYQTSVFNYDELAIGKTLSWRQHQTKRIIFCEGFLGMQNPWFAHLPFQPVKGEILTLQHSFKLQNILNYGEWLIPLSGQQARVGATFSQELNVTEPSATARASLLFNLAQISPQLAASQVLAQHVGVRPTTLDKQPFVGLHPRYPQLGIFNGFGAKGSLLIPALSQQFVAHLLFDAALPKESNVLRYFG